MRSVLLVLRRGETVSPRLRQALAADAGTASQAVGSLHEIAVEYGGAAGPDLPALAQRAGMNLATYIGAHAAVELKLKLVSTKSFNHF